MNNMNMKYAIIIQTGLGSFRPLAGWDTLYASRSEAVAAADRAGRNDGWSAKVVSMTGAESVELGWEVI